MEKKHRSSCRCNSKEGDLHPSLGVVSTRRADLDDNADGAKPFFQPDLRLETWLQSRRRRQEPLYVLVCPDGQRRRLFGRKNAYLGGRLVVGCKAKRLLAQTFLLYGNLCVSKTCLQGFDPSLSLSHTPAAFCWFIPGSRFFTCGRAGDIMVWDPKTGQTRICHVPVLIIVDWPAATILNLAKRCKSTCRPCKKTCIMICVHVKGGFVIQRSDRFGILFACSCAMFTQDDPQLTVQCVGRPQWLLKPRHVKHICMSETSRSFRWFRLPFRGWPLHTPWPYTFLHRWIEQDAACVTGATWHSYSCVVHATPRQTKTEPNHS